MEENSRLILDLQHLKKKLPYGAFPPEGVGGFSPLRCSTGRVSTAKKWVRPGLSRIELYSSRSSPPWL